MKTNLSKIKILKNLKLNILNGFTTKINFNTHFKKHIKVYKLPLKVKILKLLYNLTKNKIKSYLNKFNVYNLIKLYNILKFRLDYILFNAKLFLTLNQARQNINHNHIIVNNKVINSYTRIVKPEEYIYVYNINNVLLKNILSYNYIVQNIKDNIHCKKIVKVTNLNNDKKFTLIKMNKVLLNTILCVKYFKLKINTKQFYNCTLKENTLN